MFYVPAAAVPRCLHEPPAQIRHFPIIFFRSLRAPGLPEGLEHVVPALQGGVVARCASLLIRHQGAPQPKAFAEAAFFRRFLQCWQITIITRLEYGTRVLRRRRDVFIC